MKFCATATTKSLIQNPETKEIVGCYTLIGEDGTKKAVKARKGVIMCCGGFEFNEEPQEQVSQVLPVQVRRLALEHGRRH